jgi:hypothetical protein
MALLIVQNLFGDGAVEFVAGHLPRVEVHPGELGVTIKHLLKVGCTVQYVWLPADGSSHTGSYLEPIGAGLGGVSPAATEAPRTR